MCDEHSSWCSRARRGRAAPTLPPPVTTHHVAKVISGVRAILELILGRFKGDRAERVWDKQEMPARDVILQLIPAEVHPDGSTRLCQGYSP